LVGASFLARVLRRCGVLLITPLRILKWFLQSLSVQCYSLSTLCSIFCCMNAMTLFSFPCCLHGLSSQYTILLSETNYFMILYPWEPQYNICSLLTYADNNVFWVLLLWNILGVSHNIVCDYWCMPIIMSVQYYIAMKYESHNIVWWLLTYADNNVWWVQYIAMKYFTVLYPCEPQYCLLSTDVFSQYCLLNNIAMKYFTILYIHVCHNIVCWLLNVCWQ
jgi:hypothetical protein